MLPTFSIPSIGPKQGKVWGTTQLMFAWNSVEFHRILVKRGGYSSCHLHKHKWNRFVLLSGLLIIRMYRGAEVVDETILRPGQITDIPPGVLHEFEALEDCEALEVYWVVLDAQDIDRGNSQGGLKSD